MKHLFNLRSNNSKQLIESPGQSHHSVPNDTEAAILAFRTITTMLSLINSPTEITRSGKKGGPSKDERRDLKLLDALAALTVRRHEIVAIMSTGNNQFGLEVLVSVNNMDPTLNIPQHSSESHRHRDASWTLKTPIRWLITPNPRDHARRGNEKDKIDSLTRTRQETSMTLVDPDTKISQQLSTATPDNLLKTFLLTEW